MLIRNHHRDRSSTVGMNRKTDFGGEKEKKKRDEPAGSLDDY